MEYTLDDLQKDIAGYSLSKNKLPRSKHAVVKLHESVKFVDLCVLSNTQIGLTGAHLRTAKDDKPFRINKFKAHIEELAKDPNARIMLGGDLFYFPGGGRKYRELYSPSYDEQIEMMAQLLEPIKDKIIGAIDGTDEIKIFELDGINMTEKLIQKLGLPKNRYFGQMAEVDFEFKNDYTNHTSKTVHTLFDHGFLVANVMNTVAKKTEGLQSKIAGKDFYFSSHYNKMFIEKNATLVKEADRFVKKPCYFISVGGYRDFPNRLTSNRNTAPASTHNGVIRMFVALNPDRNNIHGHDYLGEPQYKVCQEFVNFGTTTSSHLDFDLCEEIARLNQENTLVQEELTRLIKQKIENINKQNTEDTLNKFYGEKEAQERKKAKKAHPKTKDAVVKVFIDEGGRE